MLILIPVNFSFEQSLTLQWLYFKLYFWYSMSILAILARLGKLARPARPHLEITLTFSLNLIS